MQTVDNNKQWIDNPRKISDKQLVDLQSYLEELGDLSGVVYCENAKAYVGGNQRSKVFDGANITITEKLKKPSKTGTTAYGFIEYKGEKYNYRSVKFSESDFKKACIVANSAGGEWNTDKLDAWDKEELKDWGVKLDSFDESDIYETEGSEIDYSDKNKEIDVDDFSDKMTLKLDLEEEAYHFVVEALGENKEEKLLELLGYEE